MVKVFVYGTLRKGCTNHRLLEDIDFVDAECKGIERFWKVGYSFPFARHNKESKIYGELYSVDKETLARLDLLEGHPSFYKRELLRVSDSKGKEYQAWIYLVQK
ncbi:MAG: gamma-glutamylcyclotransferase family protein [Candidatus Kapaibacterium sp.]|jgi:gamma-glutamylaminecyclotransferase